MPSIKVEFKGQLVNLGTGLNSLQEVRKQLAQRFTKVIYSQTPLCFFLAAAPNIEIHSLQDIKSEKTIKLKAKIGSNIKESFMRESSFIGDQSFLEINNSTVLQPFSSEIREGQSLSSKAELADQSLGQFQKYYYTCFKCQGRGFTKNEGYPTKCILCNGKKFLNQSHECVKFLDQLIRSRKDMESKLKEKETELQQLQPLKRKLSQIPRFQNLSIQVKELNQFSHIKLHEAFKRSFILKNNGDSDWPEEVRLIDCQSGESIKIEGLKQGGTCNIEVGPYVCLDEGRMEKTFFAVGLVDGKEVRFGHKFGFGVHGVKPLDVIKLSVNLSQKLKQLKKAAGSSKSEEYLASKLKSIGIDVATSDLPEEYLLDIVSQIQ